MGNRKKLARQRLVFADYFLAFSTREVSGNADVWRLYTEDNGFDPLSSSKGNVQISGDLYATPDLKNICSTCYPLIGPYDTQDGDVAEYHVLLAKVAGIDGFMGEWAFEGMSRDKALINLANMGARYDFRIGANWCEYGHFTWQEFKDRRESMEAAKKGFLHLLKNIYGPCGAMVDGRPLVLLFDAKAEEAGSPKDAYFTPDDIKELRAAANQEGYDPCILTRGVCEGMAGAADGFFAWILPHGSKVPADEQWTMVGDRRKQSVDLRDFYEDAEQLKKAGRISFYMGGVWQGFDDHKGQAWGSGEKRYTPRDGGQTLKDTWKELNGSNTDIAMIVAWNDWEEATNIEPSIETGYSDLEECARQISAWKNIQLKMDLLKLPEKLFRLRKRVHFFRKTVIREDAVQSLDNMLDEMGRALAARNESKSRMLLARAEKLSSKLGKPVISEKVSLMWEFSGEPLGIEPFMPAAITKIEADRIEGLELAGDPQELKCRISEAAREKLGRCHFIGRLSVEYLDSGTDFIKVIVDDKRETHQVIANFRKRNTGKWMKASMDMVNCRFEGGLPEGADFIIRQHGSAAGGIRLIRLDGEIYYTG